MRIFLFLYICCHLSVTIYSSKRFRLGRLNTGGLDAPACPKDVVTPKEQWFTQKLDHFSPTNLRTWQQRYFINDTFYDLKKKEGPIFLMIEGEGPANPVWGVKGAWIEFAEKLQALCIMVEHRYYGMSHPVPDMSVKNLEFLNSRQALADLANFIGYMSDKYDLKKNTKWIVFGGSYSGSLSAWMRLKYPHLVYAAVSSSSPLQAKLDFEEYLEVVLDSLYAKTGDGNCVYAVKLAHSTIAVLMNNQSHVLDNVFNLCTPLKNASALDVKVFYNNIADVFAEVVQYNEDNSISKRDRNVTINTICDVLRNPNHPYFINLGKLVSSMLESKDKKCVDYSYDNMIRDLQKHTWTNDSARQWTYQTCTEFGYYQTSTGAATAFGEDCDIKFYIQQCQDIFGPKFDAKFIEAAVKDTNNYYGGKDIAATRVLYVQGSIDPWHALGINATTDASSPLIYINGTAHCADMYPSCANDSMPLRRARKVIYHQLEQWIGSD